MMSIAAFCLAYAGFVALCLGMDRHYEAVFDRELPRLHRTVEWSGILTLARLLLI